MVTEPATYLNRSGSPSSGTRSSGASRTDSWSAGSTGTIGARIRYNKTRNTATTVKGGWTNTLNFAASDVDTPYPWMSSLDSTPSPRRWPTTIARRLA